MTPAEVVLHLVDDLPGEHVAHLADLLRAETQLDWGRLAHRLRAAIPQMDVQERVQRFVAEWQTLPQPPTPGEMALLLRAVSDALTYQRSKQKIELIWTGPRSSQINLRRTDQALLELIHAAQEHVLIVSFVVANARNILSALNQAAGRGVEITIVLETPDSSEGKMSCDTIRALGSALRQRSRVFIWPAAKRPTTPDGKTGSLHAKLAIADRTHLFISSANLTDYAMNLNMEFGILVKGGSYPAQARSHFDALIEQGVLVQVK